MDTTSSLSDYLGYVNPLDDKKRTKENAFLAKIKLYIVSKSCILFLGDYIMNIYKFKFNHEDGNLSFLGIISEGPVMARKSLAKSIYNDHTKRAGFAPTQKEIESGLVLLREVVPVNCNQIVYDHYFDHEDILGSFPHT